MSITVMKQALDCLQAAYNLQQIDDLIPAHAPVKQAVSALRQAIEQAEKQEPTEDMVLALRGASGLGTEDAIDALRDVLAVMPLYTTPQPQREWVGLTQQDIDIAFDDTQEGGGFNEFARAIEQTLKRKNT